jgi:hypothetical protein
VLLLPASPALSLLLQQQSPPALLLLLLLLLVVVVVGHGMQSDVWPTLTLEWQQQAEGLPCALLPVLLSPPAQPL